MSNDRGELAQMLLAAIKEAPHIWIDSQLGPKEVTIDGAVDLTAVAAALTAAGYRKPRTITTAEELDVLADKTVFLDRFEYGMVMHPTLRGDKEYAEAVLPATILWEPTS